MLTKLYDFLKKKYHSSRKFSSFVVNVKNLKHKCFIPFISVIAKFRFLAPFYVFFSNGFKNEITSVLAGIVEHNSQKKNGKTGLEYQLRRNIHRIEKGLISKDRKKTFALDYIRETIDLLELFSIKATKTRNCSNTTLCWAYSILKEYFFVVEKDEYLNELHKKFKKITIENKSVFANAEQKYRYQKIETADFDPSSILKLFETKKSVRYFEKKEVSQELIENALGAASLAHSACNRQPFRFIIITKPTLIKKISGLAFGTSSFYDYINYLAVVISEHNAFSNENNRHIPIIDSSLASAYFTLYLHSQGIESCFLNWANHSNRDKIARKSLDLKDYEAINYLIAFGYPDKSAKVAISKRKKVNEFVDFL